MRKGSNPSNNQAVADEKALHRVIIPVYIPNQEDFFREALPIFEYCLASLEKTSTTELRISVVSNGCCAEVNARLFDIRQEGRIDELIIETEPIGKINSLLKVLRTVEEPFITITDADVLFDANWEDAVLDVFRAFPKAGSVCPVPVFRKSFHLTSNIWFRYFFSKKLKFRPVKNPEGMTRFALSIGWEWLPEKYKDVNVTLEADNGLLATVGTSHFVATYRKEVFTKLPEGNSKFRIRGNSELLYMDEPVLKKGAYRLSTYDNYAFHMGNTTEPWMLEKFASLAQKPKQKLDVQLKKLGNPWLNPMWADAVFKGMLASPAVYRYILRKKGLTKNQAEEYFKM